MYPQKGGVILERRTGRPPMETGKKELSIKFRIDEETFKRLNFCAEKLNTTRSGVIRKGIDLVFKELN